MLTLKDYNESKSLILDHVVYEMQMYLFSSYLMKTSNQLLFNVMWEDHLTHLRNLIDFFSDNSNYLRYNDILNDVPNMVLAPEKIKKAKRIVSKTVSHLTIERKTDKSLTMDARSDIEAIKPLIFEKIHEFLAVLHTHIKPEYRYELDVTRINEDVKGIVELLKKEKDDLEYSIAFKDGDTYHIW